MSAPATAELVRVTMEDLAFLRSDWDQDVGSTEVGCFLTPDVARQVFGSPDDSPERELSLKKFLDSACIAARGTKISRRTLIKYVANKLGGVHFDPQRDLNKVEEQQFLSSTESVTSA